MPLVASDAVKDFIAKEATRCARLAECHRRIAKDEAKEAAFLEEQRIKGWYGIIIDLIRALEKRASENDQMPKTRLSEDARSSENDQVSKALGLSEDVQAPKTHRHRCIRLANKDEQALKVAQASEDNK